MLCDQAGIRTCKTHYLLHYGAQPENKNFMEDTVIPVLNPVQP